MRRVPSDAPTVDWAVIRKIFENPRLRILFLASGVHWASTMPFHGFFPLHVADLSLSPSVAGLGFSFAGLCEILMLAQSSRVLRRFSASQLFVFSTAISALRWLLTGLITDPTLLVGVQALHAFTFAAFYVAALQILVEEIPDRLRATGQGLFFSLAFGVGGGVGVLATGFVYGAFDGTAIFLFGAGLSCVATVIASRL